MTNRSSNQFKGYASPNYTPVPDELFDEQLPDLSGAELKVLLYVIRRTFGFKRESDNISISQMLNGLHTYDGRLLDRGVGLTKKTLLLAIKSLEEKNVIFTERRRSVERGDEPTSYRLNIAEASAREKTTPPVGEKLPQGGGGEIPPGPWGRNYPTQDTEGNTDIDHSNIRKTNRSNDDFVDNSASQPISNGGDQTISRTRSDTHHGVEDLRSIIARVAPNVDDLVPAKRSRGRPRKMPAVPPETYEAVVAVMQDYTRKLGDGEHLASNITQAANLIAASGCDFNTFYMHVIDAYKITCQRNGLDNRSGYFFTVLRDRLLPSDTVGGPTP